MTRVEMVPAADVEPVRYGKWVPGKEIARTLLGDETLAIEYSDFRCSSCGRRYQEYVLDYRYCPNCGARMDKEEADHENYTCQAGGGVPSSPAVTIGR